MCATEAGRVYSVKRHAQVALMVETVLGIAVAKIAVCAIQRMVHATVCVVTMVINASPSVRLGLLGMAAISRVYARMEQLAIR